MKIGSRVSEILAVVGLTLTVVALPAQAATPVAKPKPPVTKSVVTAASPFTPQGTLRGPLTKGEFDPTMCDTSPFTVHKGVYECGASVDHEPACWQITAPGDRLLAVCMHTPQDKTYQARYLAKPLPVAKPVAHPDPWQVVLDNGGVCDVRVGGAWGPAPKGYYYTFGCSGKIGALIARGDGPTMITKSAHFTAWGVRASQMDRAVPAKTLVWVKRVIYAAATPRGAHATAAQVRPLR